MITPITRTFDQDNFARQRSHSAGAAVSYVLRATAGFADAILVTNNTGTAGFLQIHDASALPANGNVPLVSVPLPANEAIGISGIPLFGLTGLVAAISTTSDTLTISTNAALFYALTRN